MEKNFKTLAPNNFKAGFSCSESIAKAAVEYAKKNEFNVLFIDTAGRLHVDEEMMAELVEIKEATGATQTILVVDAMTGQDAVNVAQTFDGKIGIDGVVLTKLDGDTRGGGKEYRA